MREGDTIIFVEDETPQARSARKGTPRRNREVNRSINKVGHIDSVDRIVGTTARFKKDSRAGFSRVDGQELAASRSERASQGEPTRRALICPENAFQLPRGLTATVESIELDDATIEAIERYDKAVRKSRGEVV